MARSAEAIDAKARFVVAGPELNEATNVGKDSSTPSVPFFLAPNSKMIAKIVKENNRLQDTGIFFSAVEVDKCPPPQISL